MSLAPGTRLGVYEILSPLGAGGMGEVYRAHDGRLNRDVAIKVLPEIFTADPDRLARFTREAQTLARLNHPNIAAIYGLEESGSVRALIMELVAGDDLAAIIRRGPVPLAETLAIARQIADALEAAHELVRDLIASKRSLRDRIPDHGNRIPEEIQVSNCPPASESTNSEQFGCVRNSDAGLDGSISPRTVRRMIPALAGPFARSHTSFDASSAFRPTVSPHRGRF